MGSHSRSCGVDTVVLGSDVWRRRFDADDALVGSTIDLHIRDLSRPVGPSRFTVLGAATALVRFPPVEADFQLGVASVIDTMTRYRCSPSRCR